LFQQNTLLAIDNNNRPIQKPQYYMHERKYYRAGL